MKKSSFLKVLKLLALVAIIIVAFSSKIYAEESYNGVLPRVKTEDEGVRLTDYDVSQFILSQTTDSVKNNSSLKDITKKGADGLKSFPTGAVPASYQITNFGGIKNQKSTETCWSFSTIKAFETTLANKYGDTSRIQASDYTDYSEMFNEYVTSYTFTDGTNSVGYYRELDGGGFADVAYGAMTNGTAPVYDTDFPFTASTSSKKPLSSINIPSKKVITGYEYFPSIYKSFSSGAVTYKDADGNTLNATQVATIRNMIKTHIMTYGSCTGYICSYPQYFDTGVERTGESFFNNEDESTNHAISIIGWDDNYSKDNFNSSRKPSSNGAWIAANSWGTTFHTDGIFYISYEDMTLENEITGVLEVSDVDYTNIYQTDFYTQNFVLTASLNGTSASSLFLANAFTRTAATSEEVSSVGIRAVENCSGNIYINPNDDDVTLGSATLVGSFSNVSAGYHRIPVTKTTLTGSKFVVIVEYFPNSDNSVRIPMEINYSNRQDYINYAKRFGTIGDNVTLIGNAMYFNAKKEADFSGYSINGRDYTNLASRSYPGTSAVPVMVDGGVQYFNNGLQVDSASAESCVKVYTNAVIDYKVLHLSAVTGQQLAPQTVGYAASGTEVTINPLDIDGYLKPESQKQVVTQDNKSFVLNYTPITYSVKFNSNGGTGTMQDEQMTYDEDKALNTNNFVKPGYKFAGWATESGSNQVAYTDGQTVKNLSKTQDETVNLYAVWTPIKYTIQFNANSGSGSMTKMTGLEYDKEYNLTTCSYKKTGYTFKGWNSDQTATTVQYTDGQAISKLSEVDGDTVNLYAIWEANTYAIHFDGNGATSGTMEDMTMTYGVPQNLTANAFERTGYTFKGWGISNTATVAKYTDGQEVDKLTNNPNETVTIYALWTPIRYAIHFDGNGATAGTMSNMSNLEYDKTYVLNTNTFTKTNFAFAGWAETADATSPKYVNKDSIINLSSTNGDTVTLYAVWSNNVYSVRFNSNNGDGETFIANVERDKNYRLDANPFEYVGHTFQNWNTAQDGTGDSYAVGATINNFAEIGETRDLYATWNVNTYKIAFNRNGGTSGTMSNMTYSYGETKPLTENVYTRPGYTFIGWATTNSATSPEYADKQEITNLTAENNKTITLYAVWQANNYTVHFNANGGTGTMADMPMVYGVKANLTKNTFERTGYAFQGWALTDTATTVKYRDEQEVDQLTTVQDGVVNLYAVWKPLTYSIAFDGNGATSGSMLNLAMTYGTPKQLSQNKYLKTGYTFQGWGETADATTPKYSDKELVDKLATEQGAEVRLYAVWKANDYTIHFEPNGATSGSMDDIPMTYDSEIALPQNTFERTGYIFLGWANSSGSSTPNYQDKETVSNLSTSPNATVKLYAVWKAKEYTIHFEPNGGTGTMADTNTIKYGVNYSLPSNAFVNTGFAFVGWNTDQNATSALYTNMQTITGIDCPDGSVVTLYAIWTNNAYTVRYNSNNGKDEVVSKGAEYNILYNFEPNPFEYVGHTFRSWNSAYDGTGTSYPPGGTIMNMAEIGETVDLYATWNVNTYKIAFNKNGGTSGTMSNMTYSYGESKALAENKYTRTGYSFKGWATDSSSNTVEFTDKQVITNLTENNNETITLYAVWEPNTYSVHFDGNGATAGSMDDMPMTYGQAKNLTKNTFTRDGYTFQGWATTSSSKTVKYTDEQEVNNLNSSANAVVNLYAVWKANNYTVHFDGNGATSGTMTDLAMTYDVEKALTKNTFKKTGYTFAGWQVEVSSSTTPTPSGTTPTDSEWIIPVGDPAVTYHDQEKVRNLTTSPNAVVTLYAVWDANEYLIHFDGNGATSGTMSDLPMTYDLPRNLSANEYARTGYKFAGWATTQNESTPKYTDQESVQNLSETQGAEVVLYAVWTPNTYSIHFDANGGNGTQMADMTDLKYGTAYTLTANTYTRSGLAFVGWSRESTATTATYTDKQSITGIECEDGDTVTLYAIWTNNAYTVKYHSNDGTDNTFEGAGIKDEDYEIAANTFVYTGHTFQSWNAAQDGTGTSYIPGRKYKNLTTVGGTYDLYATWNVNTYKVAFNGNGGTGSMSQMTYSYGESKALNENKFVRQGYTFKGWAQESSATTPEYTDKQVVSNITEENNKTVTLYAVWEANTYTVKFDANGGTGSMSDLVMKYGETKDLPQNTFTKDGNGFKGWTKVSGSNQVDYADKGTISNLSSTNGAVITLYAVWGPVEYKIHFDANGGDGTQMQDMNMVYGTAANLTENSYTRDGFNFIGWAEDADATVAEYTDKQEVNNLSEEEGHVVNLYAIWSPYSYTIKFDKNGGEGTEIPDMTLPYNEEANLNANTYTKAGYVFGTWNTKQDGSGVSFNDGQAVQSLSNENNGVVTLYAIWNPIHYTIHFSAVGEGFTGSTPDQVCAYGTKYNLNENGFKKEGYHLVKWTLDEAGTSSTYYTDKQEVKNLADTEGTVINLYGQFEINTYKIVFDSNGGQGSMDGIDATYGESYVIPGNTMTRNGYDFVGWTLNQDGSGTVYKEGDPVTNLTDLNDESVHLYAKWAARTYTIEYDTAGGINNPDNPETYTPDDEITLKEPTRTDYTFIGWTGSNGDTPQKSVTITKGTWGELSYTANWVDREVTYYVNIYKQGLDGEYSDVPDDRIESLSIIHKEVTEEPDAIEGFDTPEVQTVTIDEDGQEINFYYQRKSYTLTVEKDEGIANVEVKEKYLYEEEINPVVTFENGYSNAVWSINNFPGSKMPARDLTVSVRAALAQYSIKYNLNGGNVDGINPTTYTSNSPDIYIISPTKEGYRFDGWETNNPGGSVIYTGTKGNLTFTARWAEAGGIVMPSKYDYTVEHYKQTIAGTYPKVPTETESGITVADTTVTPEVKSYEGYKSPAPQKVTISQNNMVIRYYYERESYTVTINKGPGITSVTGEGTYVYQDKVRLSAETEVEDAVVVWTCGGVIQDTVFNMPSHDMVINCFTTNTLNKYYVTYELDGGYAEGNPDSFTIEDEFTLNNPTRNGYTFIGWTSDEDGSLQMEVKVPKGTNHDLHFVAHWRRIEETPSTVRYNVEEYLERADGSFGTIPDYTSTYVGEKGSVVKVNTSEFEGYVSPECEIIVLNEEKTVRYYYSRNTYKLTIEQGPGIERIYGTNLDKNTFKFGEDFEIKADIKEGYQNLTWTENGTRLESPYNRMPAHDVYIKCSAQRISYQISYDLKGGQISNNPTNYTVEDELTLPQPIKYGYTFVGWTGSNGSNPQTTVTIAKGSTGDKHYTAVWEKMKQGASMDLSIGFSTVRPTNQNVTAYIISNTKLKETGDWKYFEDEYKLHKVFSENTEELLYVEPQDSDESLPVKIIVSNIDKTPPKIEMSSYYVNDNKSKVITLKSDKYVESIDGWHTDDNLTFVKTFSANASETVVLKDKAGNQVSKYVVVNDLKPGVKNLNLTGSSLSQVGAANTNTNTGARRITDANTNTNTNRNNAYVNNGVDNTMDGNMPKTGSSSSAVLFIIGIPLLVVAIVVFRKYKLNSFRY